MLNVGLLNKDATIVGLSMNYPNVDKAKDIINNLVVAYNQDAISDKNSQSKETMKFIEGRIEVISSELQSVENEKERFKEKTIFSYYIDPIITKTDWNSFAFSI